MERSTYRGLVSVGTFGKMQQPDGLNVISAKWVLAWKPNEHGYVVGTKARLVARGFKQRENIDFLILLPRRPLRLGLTCWVLLRLSWVWICVILMASNHSYSQV